MDFLKEKWSLWFTILDINRDGMITPDDVDQALQNFRKEEGLTQAVGKLGAKNFEKWWNTYFLQGRDKITEIEFLQDLERQYTKNKEDFIKTMRACTDDFIEIMDVDKTKTISLDKYVKAYKWAGYDNEALLRKSFELYKPDDGIISVQEYSDNWVTFLTNEDPSKTDVVMDTHKARLI